jgi:hypothetical protein
MKTKIITLGLFVAVLLLATATQAGDESTAIEAAIEKTYIGGIWMNGDEEAARGGFDSSFVMQVAQEDHVISVSLDAWMERLGLHGEPLQENITHTIQVLDQTGRAAVAKVEIFKDGEALYTDYMSLYSFEDGWKIVAKTFHTHK